VNENDLVNKEELEYRRAFTDNDILAALVAINLEADLAVLLTDVDGLFRGDPKRDADAVLLERIACVDDSVMRLAGGETNALGLGGMQSKVRAAEMMTRSGIDVIVANGRRRIDDIIANRVPRSFFAAAAP
jgi:glutamate 5-kinase